MIDALRAEIEVSGLQILTEKEIPYGHQFKLSDGISEGVLRFYRGKKGERLDFSQIKDEGLRLQLLLLLQKKSRFSSLIPPQNQSLLAESSMVLTTDDSKEDLKKPLIGVDESGKGDYFGPLVVAAVYVDEDTWDRLREAGVQDSKALTDRDILKLAVLIKKNCPYELLPLMPIKYNELYASISNLNRLLAWGHARVIENLLGRVDCQNVLSDQFAKASLLESVLMERGRMARVSQRTKAESNIAVAAASILARESYVTELGKLSHSYGVDFPKGVSQKTVNALNAFKDKHGDLELASVAKLHFKIKSKY